MRRHVSIAALLIVISSGVHAAPPDARRGDTPLTYPTSDHVDQVDDYHGTLVPDPFRWLEELDSKQTKSWVDAQNELTFGYLKGIPERKKIEQRLTELWNYERYGLPRTRGGRYFYTRNDGLQNQSVLYVAEQLDAEPRVLLDPNKLSKDGTVALASWAPSEDGQLLAFSLQIDGSDWREWRVLDVATGEERKDRLEWSKFSGASWTLDSKGFFYSRYDEPADGKQFTGANYYQKLCYHRIGQPQSDDVLVYERQDEKEWGFGGDVTEDGRYLIITVWRGTEPKNQVFFKDLKADDAKVVELITGFDAEFDFIGNDGSTFWFTTDHDAPLRRVIAVDAQRTDRHTWREVIPETKHVLRGVGLVGDRFFASYLQDAHALIHVHDTQGALERELELPGIGSASGFGGKRSDNQTFYTYTDFTTPGTIYRYDIKEATSTVYRQPDTPFDPSQFETRQEFYTSGDGTKVPMFVVHRKGLKRDGSNPTVLYGYGGFNISLTPSYSPVNLVWLEMGGVYAAPSLRGGGEYGRRWHEAGMLEKKQNVFNDFVAAADWLIAQNITCSDKLAMRGGSNGGLLVGAIMTQHPELFAAAVPAVGVLDMLRYHRFTIGWAWMSEYGSSDDKDQFRTLYAYSPLHNLRAGVRYPSTLITTGDHDDRVVPAHSFKFAATLQEAHAGKNPVLIRIETSAGHGAGTPTSKRIQAAADMLAFLVRELDVSD